MRFSQPYPISKSNLVAFEELLRQEKEKLSSHLFRLFLLIPSFFYARAIKSRHFLFDCGIFKQRKVDACVISVGNLCAGGSGKTPFTLMLAKSLAPFGKVAILSRGYRSLAEKQPPRMISEGNKAEDVGDEPLLLFSKMKDTLVIVGSDRVAAASFAVQKGAKFILLDDGMQHRRLYRNVEIVLAEDSDLTADYLPAGILREDPRRLKQATLVAMRGESPALKYYTNAPVVRIESKIEACVFADGRACNPNEIKAALFCGLANPKRFVKSVEELGVQEIVAASFVCDHKKMRREKLVEFAREALAKGANALICTEKDAIKYSQEELMTLPLPVAWLKIETVIKKNEEAFVKMINLIRSYL